MMVRANKPTRQQQAPALLWRYRPTWFAFFLLALSTFSGMFRRQQSKLILDIIKSNLILDSIPVPHHHRDDNATTAPAPETSGELIRTTTKVDQRQVHFLNNTQTSLVDRFSASWLQLRSTFMEMPFDLINTCEDASFYASTEKVSEAIMEGCLHIRAFLYGLN
jgi:hypothetical protein